MPALFGRALKDKRLSRLDFGILALHLTITSGFVVLPLMLRDQIGVPASLHWRAYLPALLGSLVAIAPLILVAERWQRSKLILLSAIATLGLALWLLSIPGGSVYAFGGRLLLFFSAFNLLEALLPTLISKYSPAAGRGTAMGFYSSSQFLGAFLGGALGGMLYGMFGAVGVLLSCFGLVVVWFVVAMGLDPPRNLRSMVLRIDTDLNHDSVAARLGNVRGVAEAVLVPEDGVVYL